MAYGRVVGPDKIPIAVGIEDLLYGIAVGIEGLLYGIAVGS